MDVLDKNTSGVFLLKYLSAAGKFRYSVECLSTAFVDYCRIISSSAYKMVSTTIIYNSVKA